MIGGTEKVMENIMNTLQEKYDFTILVEEKGEGEGAFRDLGIPIVCISKSKYYWQEVERFFKTSHFSALHVHNYKDMGAMLQMGKKCKIPILIAHSHVGRKENIIFNFLKRIKSYKTEKYATHFVACSFDAAKWLFQRHFSQSILLKNSIFIEKYQFQPLFRDEKRKEFYLQNKFVIGIVARLSKEKNHEFLLSVFQKVYLQNPDVFLWMIGDGPLRESLEIKVQELGLQESVYFAGNVKDPSQYYSVFDLFVLPSFYEGLPMTILEAQYSGLPTFVSDQVTKDADLEEELFVRYPLKQDVWVQKILDISRCSHERRKIMSKKFDIKENMKVLERIYDENK